MHQYRYKLSSRSIQILYSSIFLKKNYHLDLSSHSSKELMLCRSALRDDQANAPGITHLDEKICSHLSWGKTMKNIQHYPGVNPTSIWKTMENPCFFGPEIDCKWRMESCFLLSIFISLLEGDPHKIRRFSGDEE